MALLCQVRERGPAVSDDWVGVSLLTCNYNLLVRQSCSVQSCVRLVIAAPLCPVTAAPGPSWRAVGAQLRGHQRRGTAADREIIYINHHFILSRLKAIKAFLDGILQQSSVPATEII